MKYVMGIDGGGTGSVLKLVSLDGKELGSKEGGPTNLSAQSPKEVEAVLSELILEALADNGLKMDNCQSVCIGAAGADRPHQRALLEDIIGSIGIDGKIITTNDAEIALVAGAGALEGVIVIAGTGSIAYGRTADGRSFRTGGWGHLIGDEGSGYYIGMRGLNAALRGYDSRGESTLLLPMILEQTQVDDVDGLISYIYSDNFLKSKIANLAKIVDSAYKHGDRVAQAILDESAYELFLLAKAVLDNLHFDGNVNLVVNGSVLLKNKYVLSSFCEHIDTHYENVDIVKLNRDAAYGAAELALSS